MGNPKMFKSKGDAVDIQIAEWEGTGETVLCIHGLTANCHSFDVVAEGISPPHRILALDLRGRGLSEKTRLRLFHRSSLPGHSVPWLPTWGWRNFT